MLARCILALTLLSPVAALACDCVSGPQSLEEVLKSGATLAFEGVVESAEEASADAGTGGVHYVIRVTRAWRGIQPGDRVRVVSSNSSCGYRLTSGASLVIATKQLPPSVELRQCVKDLWVAFDAQLDTARATLDGSTRDAGVKAPATTKDAGR